MGLHRLCVAFATFSGLCMLSAMRRHIPLSPSAIRMRWILSVLIARVMSYVTKYPRWEMPRVFGRMFGSVSYVPRRNFGSFYNWGMHHDDPTKWQCLHSPRKREHFTYPGNCSNDVKCIQTWWFSVFDFIPKVACQDYFFAPLLVFSSAQVGRNLVMTTTDCTIRSTAKMAPSRQQVWSKSHHSAIQLQKAGCRWFLPLWEPLTFASQKRNQIFLGNSSWKKVRGSEIAKTQKVLWKGLVIAISS